MDCPRPAPSPPKQDRKKSNRLDLTHLLPTAGSTSRNALARLAHKGSMVLSPDVMTRSPSIGSMSPAVSPSETELKPEKKPRRKLTRESLRNLRGHRSDRNSTLNTEETDSASLRKRATDAGTLYQLYDHYEHTSFRDTMNADALEGYRPGSQQGGQVTEPESQAAARQDVRHSVSTTSSAPINPRQHFSPSSAASRQPYASFSRDSTFGNNSEVALSAPHPALASPPTDYAASVSSRHTRTSKASKWTDQSFTDFDPNAISVLSLSSDSEDDFPEPPKTAVSAPSIASLESTSSPAESRRPSNNSLSQESIRKQLKSKFRTSANSQGHFLAIPENTNSTATPQPTVNPRATSLACALVSASVASNSQPTAASTSATTSSVRSPSRLSQVSTSTCESIASQVSRPRPSVTGRQTPEVRHIAMYQSRTAPTGHRQQEPNSVAEKPHGRVRKHSEPRISELTPPISPTSLESVIASEKPTNGHDSPVLTLNGTGGAEDERFMAVTRQEELLLAAMRAKRALMRESHQVADIESLDHGRVEDERTASKKESLSSIKTVKAKARHPPPSKLRTAEASSSEDAMTMLFPKPPSARSSLAPTPRTDSTSERGSGEQEEVCLDRTISPMQPSDVTEANRDLNDFMQYETKKLPAPPRSSAHSKTSAKPSHGRTSSATPTVGQLTHPKTARHSNSPRPDSNFMTMARPSSAQAYHKPDTRSRSASRTDWRPSEVEPVIERPESSSSHYEEESEAEKKQPFPRKKEVRISAVGMQLPEIGQWGDDG